MKLQKPVMRIDQTQDPVVVETLDHELFEVRKIILSIDVILRRTLQSSIRNHEKGPRYYWDIICQHKYSGAIHAFARD